jgi:hypothetical protein
VEGGHHDVPEVVLSGAAHRVLVVLAGLAAAPTMFLVGVGEATAAPACHWEWQGPTQVYVCLQETPGKPGSTSGSRPTPSCDLVDPATLCSVTRPCNYKAWVVPYALPPGDRPSPESEPRLLTCLDGVWVSTPVWFPDAPAEPPLLAQAQEAIGNIRLPAGRLVFNPPRRTIVGVPTWLWVDGVAAGPLTGSSAFGVVAIATPDHLLIDPGDGSGPRRCPWATTQALASTSCTHQYLKASVTGPMTLDGHPAYRATVTAVWSLRFQDAGSPVVVAGAPEELTSPPWLTAVPVAEIQTHVVP